MDMAYDSGEPPQLFWCPFQCPHAPAWLICPVMGWQQRLLLYFGIYWLKQLLHAQVGQRGESSWGEHRAVNPTSTKKKGGKQQFGSWIEVKN